MCSENINGLVQYYIYIPIGIIITDDALETRHSCTKSAAMYATQKHTRHGVMTWKHFLHHLPSASLHKRSIMRTCDVKVVVSLIKLLNKQSSCRLFEAPWPSCDVTSNLILDYHISLTMLTGMRPETWALFTVQTSFNPNFKTQHRFTEFYEIWHITQSNTPYTYCMQVFVNIFIQNLTYCAVW